jgi:arsenate reductase
MTTIPNTVWYLSTCDTCKKLIKECSLEQYDFVFQDIKTQPITTTQLSVLKHKIGSYEPLFSRRAKLFQSYGLSQQQLTEQDYECYLLEHYTFLKRPVILWQQQLFIGNDKKTIHALKAALSASTK